MRRILVFCMVGMIGCGRVPAPPAVSPPEPPVIAIGEAPRELPGLPNVLRISDQLLSGGSPEGDEGFRSLQALGVKTVITVDGARPEVEQAHRFGLRYVHLPIGYDGVPREQALRLARAVRELPGPIYLHCHHGKHRGPAAAVAATRCLDSKCSAGDAEAILKRAGTSPHYQGLYASVRQLEPVPKQELERVATNFPEVAPVGRFVEHMVDIDTRWDQMKEVRGAGWRTPAAHADLDPPHVARLLREGYREAARLPEMQSHSAEMRAWLAEAEEHAAELETLLRTDRIDVKAVEQAFQQAGKDCNRCHARYRDVPRQ
jgi:protein tyrosine phosphatase (PTP) superfamily phosphohydrolase (DUF442 family)